MRNIELKLRCDDLASVEKICRAIGASDRGVLMQTDTYFNVSNGRLKLREIAPNQTELIWYNRSNQAESRHCDYHIAKIIDAQHMLAVLGGAVGIRSQVKKRRRLFLWHNVRIHLDEVEKLGTFVEFEAVMSQGEDEPTGHARIAELCRILHLREEDRQSVSYVDLLQKEIGRT